MAKKKPKKDCPRSGGLGSLADALLQAGQLSENRARSLTAETRREGRREERHVGRRATQQKREGAKEEVREQRAQRAATDRGAAREQTTAQNAEQVQQTIRRHLAEQGSGNRRWYFVARDRRVPFLRISDGIARQLERGEAGIVETSKVSGREHGVVSGPGALETLVRLDPEAVRFWVR